MNKIHVNLIYHKLILLKKMFLQFAYINCVTNTFFILIFLQIIIVLLSNISCMKLTQKFEWIAEIHEMC